MKIFVTGTRGLPDIAGGVEKHCQELYPRIALKGHDIYVSTRSTYVKTKVKSFNGVRLLNVYAPVRKSFEAIIHTFLSVLKAKRLEPDIIHIHAVGPGLIVPLAKLLGFKVVVTNHGPDYDRGKWGRSAKVMLKFGEYLGGKFADQVIVISETIRNIIKNRCKRESCLIYNGVNLPKKDYGTVYLEKYGLNKKKYILAVARLVPEKGLHLLIQAFQKLRTDEYKLVIAGDADHESGYSRKLKQTISDNENIIGTGYITGDELNQIYSNAGLFVLPSFHEGLPIALLEAMSYDLSVVVSDIPANLEVNLDKNRYFKCGDADNLAEKIDYYLHYEENISYRKIIEEKYNWDLIADQTIDLYKSALKN
ncbi:MAG: glycosyltransferase family 4 protein [Desulforegulaceae bacterium]|nr:glycosyltransferase family 4 protein [Desulforegulaceae bacterium]